MAMTERVQARIWIGGRCRRSDSHELVLAVKDAHVSVGSPGWEHVLCRPVSIDGLMEATTEGVLHLQDDAAPDGEMPLLTRTCRRLGLTYRLWHEATLEDGCCVEVWEPGMEQPVCLRGDPCDPFTNLVESLPVRLAINHLRNGEIDAALDLLQHACPDIPEVPPLVVIED
jgi:hypothetical protein